MNETTSRQTKNGDDWVEFKAVKESLDVRVVLSHFGLLEHLEARGAELVGWCPLGEEHGKKDSFSMNIEKKNFQCFACKARGSVLDFVAKFQTVDLREAAHTVIAIMGGGEVGEKKSGGRPYGKGTGGDKKEGAARESMPEAGKPARNVSPPCGDTGRDGIPAVMSFSLASRLILANKIKPEHLLVVDMDAVGIEWKKAGRE